MRLTILALGSRGDVQPLVALGGLAQLGVSFPPFGWRLQSIDTHSC